MAKNTKDAVKFLIDILPNTFLDNYSIKEVFKDISSDKNIRNGVVAFKEFLYKLYNYIITDNTLKEKPTREVHEFMDNSSLPIDFPFLNILQSILVNIGFYGTLCDNESSILIEDFEVLTIIGNANMNSQGKMPLSKFIEGLKYLKQCGIKFDGIDLNMKKPDMSNTKVIKVSYPDNQLMLIGLKTMAIAQKKLRISGHEDYFLCCNYKVIMADNYDLNLGFQDFINTLDVSLKDFVVSIHNKLLLSGLRVEIEQIKYMRFRITYFNKSKEFCTFSGSLKGYSFIIKANNIANLPELIKGFHPVLQEKISRGFGCYKKTGGDHCIGGCQGYRFPLNESFINFSDDIMIWIENELTYTKK